MNSSLVDLHSILGVIRRQLRLILGVVVAVMVLATVVVFSLEQSYTASALVLVDPGRKNVLDPSSDPMGSISDSARVDGEVEIAKSPTVLLRVVDDAKLLQDPEFEPRPGIVSRILATLHLRDFVQPTGKDLLDATLDRIRTAISVQRRGLTFLIAVQASWTNPDEAAKLANAVAKAYIDDQLEAKINSVLGARDIIQSRIVDASEALASSEDALDNFISSNILAIADETGQGALADMASQVTQANSLRQQLAATADSASASLRVRDWAALTRSLESQALAQLQSERERIQATLEAAPTSKAAADLRAQLADIDTGLEAAARKEIESLKARVASAQGNVSELKGRLRTSVLSSDLSSSTLTRIYELQKSSEIAQSQYQTLLTRLKDLDQEAYLQVADSRVVSSALAPQAASFPNVRLILALAAIASVLAGIGTAFIFESYVGGIVSVDQMRSLLRVRHAVSLPLAQGARESAADIVVDMPLSEYAESIRKVRLAIETSFKAPQEDREGGHVIMVTSSIPNEGKTATALSIARAYAQTGSTVLLIDCDLRHPSVHRHLGWAVQFGLLEYLSVQGAGKKPSLTSAVKMDERTSVNVLVGSRSSSEATDQMVTGAAFRKLVDAARLAFDVVVLDCPPIDPIVDSLFLAQFADAAVLVAKWARTSSSYVKSSFEALRNALRVDVEPVIALNQAPATVRDGKYSYYRSEA